MILRTAFRSASKKLKTLQNRAKLFVILSFFVKIRRMEFELRIIEFLQAGRTPFFDTFFQLISVLGSFVGVIFLCVLLLIFNRSLLPWYLGSYGLVLGVVRLLKFLVKRVRPYNAVDSIVSIGDVVQDYSFPSGHVACATAIAIFLGLFLFTYFKKRGERTLVVLSCGAYVALVALSRMYLGKHYLTDIIGGFAISAIICVAGIVLMLCFMIHKLKEAGLIDGIEWRRRRK